MAKNSAYSISKMGTARFYEYLALENPELNVFVLHPGIVRTTLYAKGELALDDTIDNSKSRQSLVETTCALN